MDLTPQFLRAVSLELVKPRSEINVPRVSNRAGTAFVHHAAEVRRRLGAMEAFVAKVRPAYIDILASRWLNDAGAAATMNDAERDALDQQVGRFCLNKSLGVARVFASSSPALDL